MEIKDIRNALDQKFNLCIQREADKQFYTMQTQFIQMGFNGKRRETEDYFLKLIYHPKELTGNDFDECICKEFGLKFKDNIAKTIPSLQGWNYLFDPTSGLGEGRVFGIPHEPFINLQDSDGIKIAPEFIYAIYNNFVDFHALTNLFTMCGTGIERLTKIGDKVRHAGAFSKAPVNLANIVKDGSVFCNGEITIELLGISVINSHPCAIIRYDSGESTLDMSVASTHGYIKTTGGSRYIGNIYWDLKTGWARKVILNEFVSTERKEPQQENIKRYTVRNLSIKLLTKEEFEITRLFDINSE